MYDLDSVLKDKTEINTTSKLAQKRTDRVGTNDEMGFDDLLVLIVLDALVIRIMMLIMLY